MNEQLQVHEIRIPSSSLLQSYNFYIVQHEGATLLVDAGVDRIDSWDRFNQTLTKHSIPLDQIDAILLTHHHNDHTGLINRILDDIDVPIYAHRNALPRLRRERNFLEKRIHFFQSLYEKMGCETKRIHTEIARLQSSLEKNKLQSIQGNIQFIEEGTQLYEFDVIEVPGHAIDHVLFYEPKNKVAFVGDFTIGHMHVNALVDIDHRDGSRIPSLVLYEQSIHKMLSYDVDVAYSGHGKKITNFTHRMERTLHRIEDNAKRLIALCHGEGKTAAQLAHLLYPAKYESHFPLVMSEVIGHLDRLVMRGELIQIEKDGMYYYFLT